MSKINFYPVLMALAACGGPSKKAMQSLNAQRGAGKATYAHLFYNGYQQLPVKVTLLSFT